MAQNIPGRFRRRHYEIPDGPIEEPASLRELGRRVFLVLLRAVGPEHTSLSKVGRRDGGGAEKRRGPGNPKLEGEGGCTGGRRWQVPVPNLFVDAVLKALHPHTWRYPTLSTIMVASRVLTLPLGVDEVHAVFLRAKVVRVCADGHGRASWFLTQPADRPGTGKTPRGFRPRRVATPLLSPPPVLLIQICRHTPCHRTTARHASRAQHNCEP